MMVLFIKKTLNRITNDLLFSAASIVLWVWMLISHIRTLRIHEIPDRIVFIYTGQSVLVFIFSILILAAYCSTLVWPKNHFHRSKNVRRKISSRFIFLPFIIVLANVCLPFYPVLVTNLIIFGSPAIMAWGILFRFYDDTTHSIHFHNSKVFHDVSLIFIVFTAIYFSAGLYYTSSVGEHAGDEGHYIIQATSLYYDKDLDLRNNFGDLEEQDRYLIHISPNSRGNHWYSWHSPGLSFLLAPTVPFGVLVRHLILGAISASALAGMYLLCRCIDAERTSSCLAVILLGLGIFWGVYSSRALPEVLGASLTVFGLIGVISQKKYRWLSMLPTIICISFLPWVQTRFIPLSATLFFLFFLHGVAVKEEVAVKIARFILFIFITGLLLGIFYHTQLTFFHKGMSYPVEKLLFSLPIGLWHSLASSRGILPMFPLFACALAATMYLIFEREKTLIGISILMIFLSVWLSSCSTIWFTGGGSLPGRFILVTCPVLMAALAYAFPKVSAAFKYIVIYLGIVPIVLFAAQLSILPEFGISFADPYNLEKIHPLFSGIARFYYDPYVETQLFPALILYGVVFFLIFPKEPGKIVQICMVFILVVSFWLTAKIADVKPSDRSERKLAYMLEQRNLNTSFIFVLGQKKDTLSLFDYSNRFAGHNETDVGWFTNNPELERSLPNLINISELSENDWHARGYRWATLVKPFDGYKGGRALLLEADVQGDIAFEVAVREGNRTVVEKQYKGIEEYEETFFFDGKGEGKTYLLVRLINGTGTFKTRKIAYSPYSKSLLKKGNLSL